jgi:glycosyltransferase involved in cell wall biosynthesis
MAERPRYVVHDLIFATRLARPTGVERVAINTFIASAHNNANAIALVADRSRVPAGLPVIAVGHYLPGWSTAYWRLPREVRRTGVMICGSAPASPSMRMNNMPLARIIADDFPWKRSKQMSLQGRLLFRDYESWMLDRYDLIFTISDVARVDLQQTLGREVLLAGCATGLEMSAHDVRPEGIADDRPILLLVGTVEPRKNYEALERIVTPALLADWQVIVAGRPGWQGALAVLDGLTARGVTWLQKASDANLRWLYRNAGIFLTLSHAEGFNMPLVEAGSYGLPVICSDLPIHRSVAPPWARFTSTDVDAEVLRLLLNGAAARPEPEAITRYGERFSWATVCDNIERPLLAIRSA